VQFGLEGIVDYAKQGTLRLAGRFKPKASIVLRNILA